CRYRRRSGKPLEITEDVTVRLYHLRDHFDRAGRIGFQTKVGLAPEADHAAVAYHPSVLEGAGQERAHASRKGAPGFVGGGGAHREEVIEARIAGGCPSEEPCDPRQEGPGLEFEDGTCAQHVAGTGAGEPDVAGTIPLKAVVDEDARVTYVDLAGKGTRPLPQLSFIPA